MKENKKQLFIGYTLLFMAMSAIVFSYFYLNDKTLIHNGDSWHQHYKALIYYSRYLKELFRNIFVEHRFVFPMWDFSIGEGADIITALHYYCIGDPIAFLSVLVPEKYIHLYYGFSEILRLYISGILFIELCIITGIKNKKAILAASMIYVFCYWNILNVAKHIFFLNPMIYFPMIILGLEKIFHKQKPYLFIVAVTLLSLSSFYFFYMVVVLTVVFVAVKLLVSYGKDLRAMFNLLVKIFVYALLGFLMSAVIALPVIYAMLTNNRLSIDYGLHLTYPFIYYDRLGTIFLTTDNYIWLCLGLASPTILSMLLSFKQVKKDLILFLYNLIAFIFVCFPVFGKILNGFAYVSNRWSFALALLAAYSFAAKWEEFEKNKKFLCFSVTIYSAFLMVTAWWRMVKVIPLLICFAFLGVVLLPSKYLNKRIKETAMVVLVLLSILNIADYSYSERGRNRILGMMSNEDAKQVASNTEAYAFRQYASKNLSDHGFERYSGSDLTTNAAMLVGTHSTNYYFSIANPSVFDYRSKLGVNEYSAHWYGSYDERTILYSLANVRYYIAPSSYDGILPYGFTKIGSFANNDLYESDYVLPFGYTYADVLSYEEWEKLSQVEKEEALLSKMVIKESENKEIELRSKRIPYSITANEDVEVNDHSFIVKEENASLTINFSNKADGMVYLSFDHLDYDGMEPYFFADPLTDTYLNISTSKGTTKQIEYHTNDYQFYNGKHDFTVYFGYNEDGIDSMTISFLRTGKYTFDDMYVTSMPVDWLQKNIDILKTEHMEDVKFSDNEISGSISVGKEKYLLLSIPYSKGWKAFVDGEESELYNANSCYTGLRLDPGVHQIVLRYKTPFLSYGVVISLVSVLVFTVYVLMNEKSSRRNNV